MAEIHPRTEADLERVQRELAELARQSPPAVRRALNRALRTARARGAKVAAAASGEKSRDIKRRLWPRAAKGKKLAASLRASTTRFAARGRQTARGVTIGRGSSRRQLTQAFVHRDRVYQRLGGVEKDPAGKVIQGYGRTRYPIQLITTDSVAEAWAGKISDVQAAAIDTLLKRMDHEIARMTR